MILKFEVNGNDFPELKYFNDMEYYVKTKDQCKLIKDFFYKKVVTYLLGAQPELIEDAFVMTGKLDGIQVFRIYIL